VFLSVDRANLKNGRRFICFVMYINALDRGVSENTPGQSRIICGSREFLLIFNLAKKASRQA